MREGKRGEKGERGWSGRLWNYMEGREEIKGETRATGGGKRWKH